MGKLEDEINKLKQAGKEMSDSLRKTIEEKDKSAQSSDNLTTSEKKLTTQTEQLVQSNKKVVKTIQDNIRARTAWLRRGVKGGDFKAFKLDAAGLVVDNVLKQLSEVEKNELMNEIQDYQKMGEETPSS